MRSQKRVVVEIDKDGNVTIEGEEFVGAECAHFISEIEESLGTQISQRDKPEYNQRQTISNRNLQRESR